MKCNTNVILNQQNICLINPSVAGVSKNLKLWKVEGTNDNEIRVNLDDEIELDGAVISLVMDDALKLGACSFRNSFFSDSEIPES